MTARRQLPTLEEASRGFVACKACREDPELASVLTEEWLPPRGWAGTLKGGERDVMIVALNPGAPMAGECLVYKDAGLPVCGRVPPPRISREQARVVTEHCADVYRSAGSGSARSRDHVFHKKSIGYARALLALMHGRDLGVEAVLEQCWFTDLLKCSTVRESAPQISARAFAECRRHLLSELEILRPKLIVALGGTVAGELAELPAPFAGRVVKFRHPSNGCPSLVSASHTPAFALAAKALDQPSRATSVWFERLRSSIQDELFPRRGARP